MLYFYKKGKYIIFKRTFAINFNIILLTLLFLYTLYFN